jgi:hypothetical protein
MEPVTWSKIILLGAGKQLIFVQKMMSGLNILLQSLLFSTLKAAIRFGHFLSLEFSPHVFASATARCLSEVLGDSLFLPA